MWHVPCECGELIQTAHRECICAKCGRHLDLNAWGTDPAYNVVSVEAGETIAAVNLK